MGYAHFMFFSAKKTRPPEAAARTSRPPPAAVAFAALRRYWASPELLSDAAPRPRPGRRTPSGQLPRPPPPRLQIRRGLQPRPRPRPAGAARCQAAARAHARRHQLKCQHTPPHHQAAQPPSICAEHISDSVADARAIYSSPKDQSEWNEVNGTRQKTRKYRFFWGFAGVF